MKPSRSRRERMVAGAPPGTLRVDPTAPKPSITVTAYGPMGQEVRKVVRVADLEADLGRWPVVWVNVDGLGDERVLRELGALFALHRLALEDVVNLGQRPKVESYPSCLFLVANMAPAPGAGDLHTEQLSLFLGENFVLTFQERQGDCFDGVRARIEHGKALIRRSGADYLVYALVDAVIDAYFPVVEHLGDELEALEDEVLANPERETVPRIHSIKRRLQALRRAIGPHRELLNALLRDSGAFIQGETSIHLRDCYDHVIRLTERVEVYREQCSDLMGTYLSLVSNRMNEVMKVLTIIATIFIPLGFIAGLYGMNFDPGVSRWNMPELSWPFGYPFALGIMLLLAGGLVIFFWRKGWFD